MNGNVLTCEGGDEYKTEADPDQCVGARYSHSLCPEFPHFEVKMPVLMAHHVSRRLSLVSYGGLGVFLYFYTSPSQNTSLSHPTFSLVSVTVCLI